MLTISITSYTLWSCWRVDTFVCLLSLVGLDNNTVSVQPNMSLSSRRRFTLRVMIEVKAATFSRFLCGILQGAYVIVHRQHKFEREDMLLSLVLGTYHSLR